MLDKFIAFLLPRISLDDIDDETAEAYFAVKLDFAKRRLGVFAVCIVTVSLTAFTAKNVLATLILSIPTIIIIIFTLSISKTPSLHILPFALATLDFILTVGAILLSVDINNIFFCLVAFYAVYFICLIGTFVSYRRQYRKFEELCFKRADKLATQNNKAPKYGGIFIGVLVTALSRILFQTFSISVIAVGIVYFSCYFLVPGIAELLVTTRQYKPMIDKFKDCDSFGG